jgi:ribosomal protein L11 methyltransferase
LQVFEHDHEQEQDSNGPFPMKWAEITLRCPPASVDAVTALLTSLGCGGTVTQDQSPVEASSQGYASSSVGHIITSSHHHIISVLGYLPVDDRLEPTLAELKERLRELPRFGLPVDEEIRLRTVQDQDWESAWKAYFKPLRVGRRFVVKPSWEAYTPRPDDLVLELDPGMAFGTGAHPTTQLCLEALEGKVQPGERVLDFGTGSGILAIATARLGATVVGVRQHPGGRHP